MEQLCVKTHTVLDSWCAPGGILDAGGVRASFRLYADDPRRRRTKDAIVEAYLAEQVGIEHGGRCAIVTAGVPGAGKSTAIESRGLAGHGWRVLDADRIKDHLIGDGLGRGVYDDLLGMVLPRRTLRFLLALGFLSWMTSRQPGSAPQLHCGFS